MKRAMGFIFGTRQVLPCTRQSEPYSDDGERILWLAVAIMRD